MSGRTLPLWVLVFLSDRSVNSLPIYVSLFFPSSFVFIPLRVPLQRFVTKAPIDVRKRWSFTVRIGNWEKS